MMEVEINDQKLANLKSSMAEYNKAYSFKFFSNAPPTKVIFVSSLDQNLDQILSSLIDKEKIIVLDVKSTVSKLIIFQIATSRGVLIIENKGPSPILRNFFLTHYFYVKGVRNFLIQIRKSLNLYNFLFKDVLTDYLIPKGYPPDISLMKILKEFVGKPIAQFNSDVKFIQDNPLNLHQICYAAFDVIGLYKAIPGITYEPPKPVDKTIEELIHIVYESNLAIIETKQLVIGIQNKLKGK